MSKEEAKTRQTLLEELHLAQQRVADLEETLALIQTEQKGIVTLKADPPHFSITDCNPAFIQQSGYIRDEIIGRSYDFLQEVGTELYDLLVRGEAGEFILEESSLWSKLTLSPILDNNDQPTHFVITLIPFSEIPRSPTQLALITYKIGSELATLLELDELLQKTVFLIQKKLNYPHVALYLINDNTLSLKATVTPHSLSEEEPHILKAFIDKQKVITHNVKDSHHISLLRAKNRTQSQLALPLKVSGEMVGVLDIQTSRRNAFTTDEVMIMEKLARQITMAIKNAQQYESLQQKLTDRDQAEEVLHVKDRAIAATPNGIVIADASQPDFPIIYCNPGFEKITGYSQREILGRNCRFLQGPDTASDALDKIRQALHHQQECRVILKNYRKNGQPFWNELTLAPVWDEKNRLTHYIGIQNDITERKRQEFEQQWLTKELLASEEALKQSETRIRSVVDNAIDGIITFDSRGNIETFNRAAERIFGYQAVEIIGRNIKILLTEAQRTAFIQFLADHLGSNRELLAQHKNGTVFSIDLALSEFLLGDQRMFTAIVRDITERKNLEKQLQQAQKMEAIGRFAGGIAHDFNNILTVINGQSDLLLEQYLDPQDPIRKEIEQIKEASTQATLLIRQLLVFSRKEIVQPEIINLNQLITDLQKMLHRLLSENILLKMELAPDLGQVKADSGQINQVIMNLCLNAQDAMPTGGELLIKTANVELDKSYLQQQGLELDSGPYVMLQLRDTGIGINEEMMGHIFEPFFTTKEPGKGTGLGLSTVYGIVRQIGGHVSVKSRPNQGSTFKIFLPLVKEQASSPKIKKLSPPPSSNLEGTETILLVEDELAVRLVTRKFLQKRGYQVIEAEKAEDALEICQQKKSSIDLLITDVIMPGMSGRELAQHLQRLYPGLKVLYMSGYADDALHPHGISGSDILFLAKPFSSEELAQKVRQTLNSA